MLGIAVKWYPPSTATAPALWLSAPHCPVCSAPLLARYDLDTARRTFTRETLRSREASMWRYQEVMPGAPPVSLGEGMTPLIHARRLGEHLGLDRLYIKDEGQNPTAISTR